MKTAITVEDFKNFYLKMSKGQRSIRKLRVELKKKFKGKSIPSLATLFRHSSASSENWKQLCNEVDNRSSAIAMDKIVEKKAVSSRPRRIKSYIGGKCKTFKFTYGKSN